MKMYKRSHTAELTIELQNARAFSHPGVNGNVHEERTRRHSQKQAKPYGVETLTKTAEGLCGGKT